MVRRSEKTVVAMACALALLLGCPKSKTTNQGGKDAAVKSVECTQADDTRKTARTQLAEGRLGATLDAIVAADAKCAQSERESWAERVSVLAQLGRDADAEALAKRIDVEGDAAAKTAATNARATIASNKTKTIEDLVREAIDPKNDAVDKRRRSEHARDAIEREQGAKASLVVEGTAGSVRSVLWDAKGILFAHGTQVSWYDRTPLRERARWTCKDDEAVQTVSANETMVLAATATQVCLFDRATLSLRGTLPHGAPAMLVPGKALLVAIDRRDHDWGTLVVASSDTLKETRTIRAAKAGPPFPIDVSHDGTKVALGREVHDLASGALLLALEGGEDAPASVDAVRFTPDSKSLAVAIARMGFWIRLYALDPPEQKWEAMVKRPARELTFSPGGGLLASAGTLTLRLWNGNSGSAFNYEGSLHEHDDGINSIAWSPDGTSLISASDDRTLRIWDPKTGKSVESIGLGMPTMASIDVSDDGKRLTTTELSRVTAWDLDGFRDLGEVVKPAKPKERFSDAMVRDGRLFTSSSNGLRAVDVGGTVLWSAPEIHGSTLGYDSKRKALLTSVWKSVRAIAAETGKSLGEVETGPVVELSRAGRTVSRRNDEGDAEINQGAFSIEQIDRGPLRIFDLAEKKLVVYLKADGHELWWNLAFAPDGDVVGGGGNQVVTEKPTTLFRFSGTTGEIVWKVAVPSSIRHVAVSPDGALLAVSHWKSVDLHDAKTGAVVRSIATSPRRAIFSTDGKQLYVLGVDAVHVFRVSDGRLRLDLLRPTGSNGAVALDALGRAEVFGDAGRHLQCKIGARVVPAEICDNLQIAGLAKSTMTEP